MAIADDFGRDAPRPLAGPVPPEAWPSAWEIFRAARENTITLFPRRAYRELMLGRNVARRVVLIVSDPEGVSHVLLKNADNYAKGDPQLRLLRPATGDGLLTSMGESWRRQRRIAAPSFQHKRLTGFVPDIVMETEGLIEAWEALASGGSQGHRRVDVSAEMMGLTLKIICRTMFSSDKAADTARMADALDLYFETAGRANLHMFLRLPHWIPNPAQRRARPAIQYLQHLVRGLVETRRASGELGDDLLGLLLKACDEDTGDSLCDREIEDNLITFIAAGHETTANALTWALYLLSLYPDAADRIAAEADAVFGARGAPGASSVEELVYTRMVLEEAMRLYPPVPMIEREARGDDEICGYPVERGSAVFIAPWVIHRHERLWYRPELFDPERFNPDYASSRHRFQYLPFGGGPRICIGMGFAMVEATLVLAMLVRRYRLNVDPAHPVEPVGRITLRPRGGLPVYITKR